MEIIKGIFLKVECKKHWEQYFKNCLDVKFSFEELRKIIQEELGFKGVKYYFEIKKYKHFTLGLDKFEIYIKEINSLDNQIGKFKVQMKINNKVLSPKFSSEIFYEVLRTEDFADGYNITNRKGDEIYILKI